MKVLRLRVNNDAIASYIHSYPHDFNIDGGSNYCGWGTTTIVQYRILNIRLLYDTGLHVLQIGSP